METQKIKIGSIYLKQMLEQIIIIKNSYLFNIYKVIIKPEEEP